MPRSDRKRIIDALAEAWDNEPDMRLGQLLNNSLSGQTLAERDRDMYYIEDAALADRLTDLWTEQK
jgi:hypothetical protein